MKVLIILLLAVSMQSVHGFLHGLPLPILSTILGNPTDFLSNPLQALGQVQQALAVFDFLNKIALLNSIPNLAGIPLLSGVTKSIPLENLLAMLPGLADGALGGASAPLNIVAQLLGMQPNEVQALIGQLKMPVGIVSALLSSLTPAVLASVKGGNVADNIRDLVSKIIEAVQNSAIFKQANANDPNLIDAKLLANAILINHLTVDKFLDYTTQLQINGAKLVELFTAAQKSYNTLVQNIIKDAVAKSKTDSEETD